MADAVTTQTLTDGGRLAVFKFTNVSDGTGEAAVLKVDVSTLSVDPMTRKPCTGVSIYGVTVAAVGMGVQLFWGATANVLAVEIPPDFTDQIDYEPLGGLVNNAGAGKTGDILFTTKGHTASDTYSIILMLRKSYD